MGSCPTSGIENEPFIVALAIQILRLVPLIVAVSSRTHDVVRESFIVSVPPISFAYVVSINVIVCESLLPNGRVIQTGLITLASESLGSPLISLSRSKYNETSLFDSYFNQTEELSPASE